MEDQAGGCSRSGGKKWYKHDLDHEWSLKTLHPRGAQKSQSEIFWQQNEH